MNIIKKSSLWYKFYRQNILNNVNSSNYTQAKTDLDNITNQHTTYINKSPNTRNYYYGENLIFKHAQNHLNDVINNNNPEYIDKPKEGIETIKHQSDVVIDTLNRTPKSDYINNG